MDRASAGALHTYIKSLRRYANAMIRDPDRADDLVQECLTRALVYIHDGRKIKNLRAYLFTILNHVHMDELSRQRRGGTVVPIDNESQKLSCTGEQNSRMECRDLSRAIDMLPKGQKEVVLLIGMEGLSYQAASEVLGIPIGTIMSRLSRARATLRRLLDGKVLDRKSPRDEAATGPGDTAELKLAVGE